MIIVEGEKQVRLPITPDEYNQFVKALGEYAQIEDIENYHHAIATMIMHHPQTSCMKSPDDFVQAIRKAQANEVAWGVLEALKEQEKKNQDEAALLVAGKISTEDLQNEPLRNPNVQETTEQMV